MALTDDLDIAWQKQAEAQKIMALASIAKQAYAAALYGKKALLALNGEVGDAAPPAIKAEGVAVFQKLKSLCDAMEAEHAHLLGWIPPPQRESV